MGFLTLFFELRGLSHHRAAVTRSLLDFGTESEYGAYLTPLCRAGAKLVATKNVSARVRKGTVRHNARLRTTVVWKSKAKRVWATGG